MQSVPTGNYYPGRNAPVRLVVLHTAECDCNPGAAAAVAAYLARPDVRASCHYAVDPDNTVSQVAEKDTAWTAPGANADGINIEQAGRAASTDWASGNGLRMIRTQTVPLVADICSRYGLPPQLLDAADLRAGKRGITDHRRVNDAYGLSDHTDCGNNYPLAQVCGWVRELMTGGQPAPSEEDGMILAYRQPSTGTIWLYNSVAGTKQPLAAGGMPWPQVQQAMSDLVAAKVLTPAASGALFADLSDAALALIPTR